MDESGCELGAVRRHVSLAVWIRRTITPDPKYFANLHTKVMRTKRRGKKEVNILEDISGERYLLAPLNEDGEEGTTAGANEDYEDGSDPQVEMGVRATAGPAVSLVS